MAFNPISGTFGSVSIGGTQFAFAKWKLSIKTNLPKVNNFESAFQMLTSGLTSATITIDGPYDAGNMPFTSGELYPWTLAVDESFSWLVNARIESLEPSDDIEDAARVSITAQSHGEFVPQIT